MFAPDLFISSIKFGKLVAIDDMSSTATGFSAAMPITKKDMAIL